MNRFIITTIIGATLAFPAAATKPTPPKHDQQQAQHQQQAQAQSQGQLAISSSKSASFSGSKSSSFSDSNANSNSSADNSITFEAAKTRDNTPDVALGGLFPSAVCMGVANGGVSAAGFGVGAGKSYRDLECDKRETARSFAAIGYTREALIILCSTEAAKVLESCPAAVPPVVTPVVEPKAEERKISVEDQKKQVSGEGPK